MFICESNTNFSFLFSLEHDQELDSILVGPVPVGINKFLFTADPPSAELIPSNELVSVTVILLSCSYADREFVRVGYYVNNEYDSEELRENPPNKVQVEHVTRNILAEKPRVTRFNIVWDNEDAGEEFPPEQPDADLVEDDEDQYGQGEEVEGDGEVEVEGEGDAEGEVEGDEEDVDDGEEEEEEEAAEEEEEEEVEEDIKDEEREGTVEASDKKIDENEEDGRSIKKQKPNGDSKVQSDSKEETKENIKESKEQSVPIEEEEVKTPKDDENLLDKTPADE